MTATRCAARATGAALLAAALAVGATACSDDDTSPSDVASKGADILASATAEAQKKFDEFKNGVDAKKDVELGDVSKEDGRATAPVTVKNTADAKKSYLVLVTFRDSGGNRLDAVAVQVNDVGAGASKKATARSHRSLGGDVTAELDRALSH
ncbi:hypothetical protein ACFW9D_20980 [Streptomyces sp. NPDC059524]|uniref:hypothetical protein n=1 Tax=Streptomyces sp. NPDC059524 TaxID=3346856 RepID=UPI0036B0E064